VNEAAKIRVMDAKWKSLEKQGLVRPRNEGENAKRIKESRIESAIYNVDRLERSEQARGKLDAKDKP
jgi:hypothetical protein